MKSDKATPADSKAKQFFHSLVNRRPAMRLNPSEKEMGSSAGPFLRRKVPHPQGRGRSRRGRRGSSPAASWMPARMPFSPCPRIPSPPPYQSPCDQVILEKDREGGQPIAFVKQVAFLRLDPLAPGGSLRKRPGCLWAELLVNAIK